MRAASRRDHQRFCEIEGWREVRNSRGRTTQHHLTYELVVGDGNILRTRISRPANTEVYGKGLWAHILGDQLNVTEAEFWQCVEEKIPPRRTAGNEQTDVRTLPASLAYELVHTLRMTPQQVAALSRDEALRRLREHWAQPPASD